MLSVELTGVDGLFSGHDVLEELLAGGLVMLVFEADRSLRGCWLIVAVSE